MNSVQQQSPTPCSIDEVVKQVESLRRSIEEHAELYRDVLLDLPPERTASAQNLLHYLALRQEDIRPLQDELTRLGLSSLGRVEPHVMATINAVLRNLYLLTEKAVDTTDWPDRYEDFTNGGVCLKENTTHLFGEHPGKRRDHIMVTMPIEAADDYLMVHQLLISGMNCMRINCAHDYPEIWSRMIETLRNAEQSTGLSCRILMDLGGPKLRLGPMETKPAVIKIRPVRAQEWQILRPARIWLTPAKTSFSEMPAADFPFAMIQDWLDGLKDGDRISFRDVRGSKRTWRIREKRADGCWAESKKTALMSRMVLSCRHVTRWVSPVQRQKSPVCHLEDSVCLIRKVMCCSCQQKVEPGKPAFHDSDGELLNPGKVSLAIPEVYRDVRLGEPIFFDDGRIAGIVEKREAEAAADSYHSYPQTG